MLDASSYSACEEPALGTLNVVIVACIPTASSCGVHSPQIRGPGADVEELHDAAHVRVVDEAPARVVHGKTLLAGVGTHVRRQQRAHREQRLRIVVAEQGALAGKDRGLPAGVGDMKVEQQGVPVRRGQLPKSRCLFGGVPVG